nr:NYN domain-containing protein [Helicobacter felis]
MDMKIGLDIASLAIKKQVEKIVLITNDSDFVLAIKFAKREGVIVQLDPLRQDVAEDLSPHIDLLRSVSA